MTLRASDEVLEESRTVRWLRLLKLVLTLVMLVVSIWKGLTGPLP